MDNKLEELTQAEREFLHRFASNGAAGRKMLCMLAHALVGIGMIGGAIAGIIAGAVAIFTVWHGR